MLLSIFTPDNLTMWITAITLTILFIVAAYFGSKLSWYQNLPVKSQDNVYILAAAWVIASLISFGALYIIGDEDETIYGQSRLLPWYLVISFLNLLWVVIFYIYQSFATALVFILIIILINFYLILFLLYINIWAGLLLVPLEILYIYLIYSLINLASRNNIII